MIYLICIGDFWIRGCFWQNLSNVRVPSEIENVLVGGCGEGTGSDIKVWQENGVKEIEAFDYSYHSTWQEIEAKQNGTGGTQICFFQSSAEQIQRSDNSFDLSYSQTVFEHVSHLEQAIAETMRVLRPRGISCHQIGPLYFTHGGDHCISSYGFEHGYDHIVLSKGAYQKKINDDAFFATTEDPFQAAWAKRGWFSFARPEDYMRTFRKIFSTTYSIGIISPEAIKFKRQYPEKWAGLRSRGCSETDLMIKGISIISCK
jgi:ubiquinone/menaquinone biosynthesis C-methylase UbiE